MDKKWIPKVGEKYYTPDYHWEGLYSEGVWDNGVNDNWFWERNLVLKTREAAVEVANKMLGAIR